MNKVLVFKDVGFALYIWKPIGEFTLLNETRSAFHVKGLIFKYWFDKDNYKYEEIYPNVQHQKE